jgi:hypothetical protein
MCVIHSHRRASAPGALRLRCGCEVHAQGVKFVRGRQARLVDFLVKSGVSDAGTLYANGERRAFASFMNAGCH